jgi:protein tyrosine phosphatase (PTP) superfamily phosphohydrolase (DUF442 family)
LTAAEAEIAAAAGRGYRSAACRRGDEIEDRRARLDEVRAEAQALGLGAKPDRRPVDAATPLRPFNPPRDRASAEELVRQLEYSASPLIRFLLVGPRLRSLHAAPLPMTSSPAASTVAAHARRIKKAAERTLGGYTLGGSRGYSHSSSVSSTASTVL